MREQDEIEEGLKRIEEVLNYHPQKSVKEAEENKFRISKISKIVDKFKTRLIDTRNIQRSLFDIILEAKTYRSKKSILAIRALSRTCENYKKLSQIFSYLLNTKLIYLVPEESIEVMSNLKVRIELLRDRCDKEAEFIEEQMKTIDQAL